MKTNIIQVHYPVVVEVTVEVNENGETINVLDTGKPYIDAEVSVGWDDNDVWDDDAQEWRRATETEWDAGAEKITPSPDTQAINAIVAIMSGEEWSADTLDEIADIVRNVAQRTIDDYDPNHDGTVDGAVCSDHPDILLSDGCYKCDPDDYVEVDGRYINRLALEALAESDETA